jgi:hypothetical protein
MHRCELCGVGVLSAAQLDEHLAGRRHRERLAVAGMTEAEVAAQRERQLLRLVVGGAEDAAAAPASKRPRLQFVGAEAGVHEAVRAFCGRAGGAEEGEGGCVLLYYRYVDVDDAAAAREWQLALCSALGLRGRIHVAKEGVNGTCGGSATATALYRRAMDGHARWGSLFSGIDYKVSALASAEEGRQAFPNLFVKRCDEIIALGCPPAALSWRQGASHLSPRAFHERLVRHRRRRLGPPTAGEEAPSLATAARQEPTQEPEEVAVLDVRNLYESAVGRFDGAIRCPTRHFSEFPRVAARLVAEHGLRHKTVLM